MRILFRVCVSSMHDVTCLTNNRHADVAQSAEQLSCKQQVIGSSPIVGSAGVTKSIVGSAGVTKSIVGSAGVTKSIVGFAGVTNRDRLGR